MDDATMLTLAAITYRGINLVYPEPLKSRRLRALIDECFARFFKLKDQWRIVWGPASFSGTSPGLDDSLMFVAESLAAPRTLAIAIRGTNPISITDWLFGDLMVTHQEPWPYGTGAGRGKISSSSAIGLGILQHLRWDDAITESDAGTPRPQAPELWLKSIAARLSAESGESLLDRLKQNAQNAGDAILHPLTLLKGGATSKSAQTGTTLKQCLAEYIGRGGKCDLYITGHSKGGALSSTVALWLADTQGAQDDPAELWDPTRQATLHYYSFAGPTAGDSDFAAHSDALFGDRCHRIWNYNDVVPCAFIPTHLTDVSRRYNLNGLERMTIDKLTSEVAAKVAGLNYTHPCRQGNRFDGRLLSDVPVLAQIAHQHLDSYLSNCDMLGEMTATSLLAPAL
jgi:hypothetical protein